MADIVLLNGVFPPDQYGGAENYVQRIASELTDRGYNVAILTTSPFEDQSSLQIQSEKWNGIPVYRFYPANISHRSNGTGGNVATKALWHQLDTVNPHAKRVVERFLSDHSPEIVHTNNFMGITASAGKAVDESDARYIHTLHDYSLICPKSNLLRDMTLPGDELGVCKDPPAPCRMYASAKRRMIGQPDLVIGPSQHVIDVHREHGFFEDVKATCIQHGIEKYANSVPKETSKSVLYVGKHLRAKGLDTLFEAARMVPDITFHLCGSGPYDNRSQEVASELENVKYHGFVSEEELKRLRQTVSAAVVPSIWMENSPLTIYESFSEGLPVISSNIGGIPELVDNDRGRLFPPGDSDKLANQIKDMVTMSDTGPVKSNALQWAKSRTMERHINKLIKVYNI